MFQNKQILICCPPDNKPEYLGTAADLLDPDWEPFPFFYEGAFPGEARLLISWCQFRDYERAAIMNAKKAGLATLLVADGVLEWRNTWEHPEFSRGEIYQPIIADKMACIGPAQIRILESWGNRGKCEPVGMPRLDSYLSLKKKSLRSQETFHLLIMTARNPGFTPKQVETTIMSLRDLAQWMKHHPNLHGRMIKPIWRIDAKLAGELSLSEAIGSHASLVEDLKKADAVITNPSTTQIESMLCGIPVALLDYHNRPHYVPAAWTISASSHIESVLSKLVNPDPVRMAYQEYLLHDNLFCRTPSAPRLGTLVREMLRIQEECRRGKKNLKLPQYILKPDPSTFSRTSCAESAMTKPERTG